ncbi:hypothetical protein ACWEO4_18675 [Streptomyces sp. NPDC004393]
MIIRAEATPAQSSGGPDLPRANRVPMSADELHGAFQIGGLDVLSAYVT